MYKDPKDLHFILKLNLYDINLKFINITKTVTTVNLILF